MATVSSQAKKHRAHLFRRESIERNRTQTSDFELALETAPFHLVFKRYQDKAYWAVGGQQALYIIDATSLEPIQSLALAQTPLKLLTSRNASDPFLYYTYNVVGETHELFVGAVLLSEMIDVGRIEWMCREGSVNTFDFTTDGPFATRDVAISASGMYLYSILRTELGSVFFREKTRGTSNSCETFSLSRGDIRSSFAYSLTPDQKDQYLAYGTLSPFSSWDDRRIEVDDDIESHESTKILQSRFIAQAFGESFLFGLFRYRWQNLSTSNLGTTRISM